MQAISKESKLYPAKYINDPVYGGIPVTELELKLIDTPVFQRLRGLRQLARVNYVFPGAEHSRYVHSLGVLFIMGLMTDHLLREGYIEEDDAVKMRIAALLHDIGHYPLSHLGETVYGHLEDLRLGNEILGEAQLPDEELYELASAFSKTAHHEQLGKYIVENNTEISSILNQNGLNPTEIGRIFTGEIGSENMLYSQLLHSSLDADRLDYLLRDSYQTGVKFGLVDLQYLVRLLMVTDHADGIRGKVLVCNKKGQHVVEHFLMSRYFHYSQVVYHKTSAAFEGLIKVLFIKLIKNEGFIFNNLQSIKDSVNTDDFLRFNDHNLETALEKYYDEHKEEDANYKQLYEMFKNRTRPKVVLDMKDLYDTAPSSDFSVLKWKLSSAPEEISKIIGSNKWGYQIAEISLEKIQGSYTLSEGMGDHEEDMREAVKLIDDGDVTYLAEDKLSVINKLSNFKSEFIRIYIFQNDEDANKFDEIKVSLRSSMGSIKKTTQ